MHAPFFLSGQTHFGKKNRKRINREILRQTKWTKMNIDNDGMRQTLDNKHVRTKRACKRRQTDTKLRQVIRVTDSKRPVD